MSLRSIPFKQVEKSTDATPCVVRKTWRNTNSGKNQVSVQFYQVVKRTIQTVGNALTLKAQGITINPVRKLTAIMSFNEDALVAMGLKVDHDYSVENAPLATAVFGLDEVNIEATESCMKNPRAENQQPVTNPTTGEIRTIEGNNVYLHTEVVPRVANHQFIQTLSDVKRELSVGQLAAAANTASVETSPKAFAK